MPLTGIHLKTAKCPENSALMVADFRRERTPERFEPLIIDNIDKIRRIIFRITLCPDDTEDLVQETFIRAYEKIDDFKGEAAFSSWLFRIGVNLAISFTRKMNRRGTHPLPQELTASHHHSPHQNEESNRELERIHLAIARAKQKAVKAFLAPGLNNMGWNNLLRDTITWSQRAGLVKEMVVLLKRCRKHLDERKVDKNSTFRYYKNEYQIDINKKIRKLLESHPELLEMEAMEEFQHNIGTLQSKVLLKTDNISPVVVRGLFPTTGLSMVGMIRTENHLAIICAEKRRYYPWGREHIGILKLEPETMRVLSYSGVSGLSYSTNQSSNTFNMHSDHGPRRCSAGDDVFLGLFDSGIIRFPVDGDPLHLTCDNGLVSQDIVSSMTVLHNKLYALVRESTLRWALMEVDYNKNSSRILISPHGSLDEGDLHRLRLKSVTTEPGKPNLLMNTMPNLENSSKQYWGLYRYNPRTRKGSWITSIFPGQHCRVTTQGDSTLLEDREKIGVFRPEYKRIKWYYLMKRAPLHWPTRPGFFKYINKVKIPWRGDDEVLKCVLLEDRMLLLAAEDAGIFPSSHRHPFRLWYFKQGNKEATEVKGKNIPIAEKIVDMLRMGDTALLLTHDTLYSLSL